MWSIDCSLNFSDLCSVVGSIEKGSKINGSRFIFFIFFCVRICVHIAHAQAKANRKKYASSVHNSQFRPIRTRMRLIRHNIIHWRHVTNHRSIHSLTEMFCVRDCRFVFFAFSFAFFFAFYFVCGIFVLCVSRFVCSCFFLLSVDRSARRIVCGRNAYGSVYGSVGYKLPRMHTAQHTYNLPFDALHQFVCVCFVYARVCLRVEYFFPKCIDFQLVSNLLCVCSLCLVLMWMCSVQLSCAVILDHVLHTLYEWTAYVHCCHQPKLRHL